MKEFIEKLIGRLEEASQWEDSTFDEDGYCSDDAEEVIYLYRAIEIANQLAEEFADKNCSECSRRKWYQMGYADAEKKLAEEYNNEFCEWRKENSNKYVCNAHAEIHDSRVLDWCVCPYCGKKIKIAPYQPKGE